MRTEFVISKRDGKLDVILVQGSRCIKLYAPESDDLRAAAQALDAAAGV